jgi:uncharacterized protein (DUF169 family)
MQTGQSVSTLGCIGNRVYTELGDDEFYFVAPGKHIAAIADKLAAIVNANEQLKKYHEGRLQAVRGA